MLRIPPAATPALAEAERLIVQGDRAEADGDIVAACRFFREAVDVAPGYAKAHINLGVALEAVGDTDGAIKAYEETLALDPRHANALYNLAKLLLVQAEPSRSEALLLSALAQKPDFPEAYVVLAAVYEQQSRLSAAASALETALSQRPDYPVALLNYGGVLRKLGRMADSEALFRRVTVIDPRNADAWYQLGTVQHARGVLHEAAESLRHALKCNDDSADAHALLGALLRDLRDLASAEHHLRKSIELKQDYVIAHYMLGDVLFHRNNRDEALKSFDRALSLQPDFLQAKWAKALAQIPPVYEESSEIATTRAAFLGDITELQAWINKGSTGVGREIVGMIPPFYLAYTEEDNRDLLARHGRLCAHLMDGWLHTLPPSGAFEGDRQRIEIGIVSAHIHDHSVWNAIVKGWVKHLDRRRFALSFFHLGSTTDAETQFARSNAVHFEEGSRSLEQWIHCIRERSPDLLLYPDIGMDPTTLRLASLRLAPVQAATWGHPETTGLPTIDYYISAQYLEPPGAQEHYTESLITLPGLGVCYEPLAVVPAQVDLASLDIDAHRPILLNPGTPFKYSPRHDGVWVEIARRIPSAQLVFFIGPAYRDISLLLRRRLEAAFAAAGLKFENHVRFIRWLNRREFPGLMKCAHVFLDSIGFSGFNTAMQAVEAGLPIVTREGRFMRGRLASGILKKIGLEDLVASTEQEYIEIAVRLALEGDYRNRIRERMAQSRPTLYGDLEPVHALEAFFDSVAGRGQTRIMRF